jgi:hypothetical protein
MRDFIKNKLHNTLLVDQQVDFNLNNINNIFILKNNIFIKENNFLFNLNENNLNYNNFILRSFLIRECKRT